MGADTENRRRTLAQTTAMHHLSDHHGLEAMVGIVRLGTGGIGLPTAGGRAGFGRGHAAAPRLDGHKGPDVQRLFRNEVDAVFAGILDETEMT